MGGGTREQYGAFKNLTTGLIWLVTRAVGWGQCGCTGSTFGLLSLTAGVGGGHQRVWELHFLGLKRCG